MIQVLVPLLAVLELRESGRQHFDQMPLLRQLVNHQLDLGHLAGLELVVARVVAGVEVVELDGEIVVEVQVQVAAALGLVWVEVVELGLAEVEVVALGLAEVVVVALGLAGVEVVALGLAEVVVVALELAEVEVVGLVSAEATAGVAPLR
jgi:hypothetical protein